MEDKNMETPQISRSGRVLKKSTKVKEMEDFDINELDIQGKSRKKTKTGDDFDDYDKQVAPIKIPKITFNMQGQKRKVGETSASTGKQVFKSSFQSSIKGKPDMRKQMYRNPSVVLNESDSSSDSSETTTTTTSSSDDEDLYKVIEQQYGYPGPSHPYQEKVIVQRYGEYGVLPMYMGSSSSSSSSSETSTDATIYSDDDSALVAAKDSDESASSASYPQKGQRGNSKKKVIKKNPTNASRRGRGGGRGRGAGRGGGGGRGRRKQPAKKTDTALKRRKPAEKKSEPLSAYTLWSIENRHKIGSPGSITGKKIREAWEALPEEEKMTWEQTAECLAKEKAESISSRIAALSKSRNKAASNTIDENIKDTPESHALGTAPIDTAAHLKLLGDSLTIIGQRLIEHEGQLAVSGIYSVLLDTLLCATGPLLCLTTEITGLEHLDKEVFRKTLDHIAYFMPGL